MAVCIYDFHGCLNVGIKIAQSYEIFVKPWRWWDEKKRKKFCFQSKLHYFCISYGTQSGDCAFSFHKKRQTNMAKKLSGFLMTILSPVIKELPFFVFTALMLIEQPIRNIHEQIVNPSFRTSVENLAGQVAIVFLFSYLLTALVAWARKKWLKISLYAIIGFLFAASQFLWHNFLMTINPQALVLVAETNKREASGFFDQFLFSRASLTSYAIIAAVIIAIVLAERWYHRRQHVKPRATAGKTILASLLTLVLIGGIVASKCYFRIFSYQTNDQLQNQELIHAVYPSDPISLLGQSIYGLHLCSNETKQALETNRQISKTNSTIAGTDSLNVVLVIGESYNKWHAGIYGYSLNTTPNMMREREAGNLTVFDDAVTSFGLTSPSMKNILLQQAMVQAAARHHLTPP